MFCRVVVGRVPDIAVERTGTTTTTISLKTLYRYVELNYRKTAREMTGVPGRIVKAVLVYQYLCIHNNHVLLNAADILSKHPDIGLIGPGHGMLTKILEYCFNSVQLFCNHAILHDAFGRFYHDYRRGPGYCYAISIRLPKLFRNSPLLGHVSGLLFCCKTRPNL